MLATTASHAPLTDGFGGLLRDRGFRAFLITQFLGAFNDNVYKIIVSMRAVHLAAATGSGGQYLSLAGAVFVLPFLLFSGYSGDLADRLPKRTVLVAVKGFEIAVMCFGLAAFFSTRIELMLAVLFLMALHSTVFSPAKYGIVPEMLPATELSRANALLEMSTFVAIVLGTSLGTLLFTLWKDQPWNMGLVTLAVAVAGLLTSFQITRVPAAGAKGRFQINPLAEVLAGTRHLLAQRPLWLSVLGISFFWFLGVLFQLDLLLFGSEVLRVSDLRVGLMITSLAIGIGAGSMLAGRLSGDKIELGLVPVGSLLMGIFGVALFFSRGSYGLSIAALSLLGVASGLFIVPLNAYLQHRSDPSEKGRILGTNNFYNTLGMLLASGTLWSLHDKLHAGPDKLILLCGVLTLLVTVYVVTVLPRHAVRFPLWLLMHTFYRFQILGRENVPNRGPALLVVNHVTWLDGFLVGACIQRFVRYMIWKPYFEARGFHTFVRFIRAIPVDESNPRQIVYSIRRARQELQQGHVVCIFAEGSMTRTGNLLPFKRGLEKIVAGLDVPLIPVHLGGVWGSIFSFSGGRFLKKWPSRIPYPVTVSFGGPMPPGATSDQVRQSMLELASEAARVNGRDCLASRFVKTARRHWRRPAIPNGGGGFLTYGQTLTRALALARRTSRRESPGTLVAGPLGQIVAALAGRASVLSAVGPPSVFDRLRASWLPARWLFTSPVSCSAAVRNVDALQQVLWLTPEDRVAGLLGEGWGAVLSLWLPLLNGCAAGVPPAEATVLVGDPAWFEEYATSGHSAAPRLALSIGPAPLPEACRQELGFEVLDGFGCAEALVISLNTPDRADGAMMQTGQKAGTQGHPLPGVAVRIVDEAGATLPAGSEGRLLVRLSSGWVDTGARSSVDAEGFLTLKTEPQRLP